MANLNSLKRKTLVSIIIVGFLILILLLIKEKKIFLRNYNEKVSFRFKGKEIIFNYKGDIVGKLNLAPTINNLPCDVSNFIKTKSGYKANLIQYEGTVYLNLIQNGFVYWVETDDNNIQNIKYFGDSNFKLHNITYLKGDTPVPIYDINGENGIKIYLKDIPDSLAKIRSYKIATGLVLKTLSKDAIFGRISLGILDEAFAKVFLSYKKGGFEFNFVNPNYSSSKKKYPLVFILTDLNYDSDIISLVEQAKERYFKD